MKTSANPYTPLRLRYKARREQKKQEKIKVLKRVDTGKRI